MNLKETMLSISDPYTIIDRSDTLGTTPALEVRGLRVGYGDQPVLDNVTFQLPPGQLVGIIGPNGAGKTTLLKAIIGLIPRMEGSVAIAGASASRRRAAI